MNVTYEKWILFLNVGHKHGVELSPKVKQHTILDWNVLIKKQNEGIDASQILLSMVQLPF